MKPTHFPKPLEARFALRFGGIAGAVLAVGMSLLPTPEAAAAVYTRFDDNDSLTDWTPIYNGTPTSPMSIADAPDGEPALRMIRPGGGSTANNAFIYYNNASGELADQTVADLSITSTFTAVFADSSNSSRYGFMVRASAASYTNSKGYYIAFTPSGGGSLALYDSPTTHSLNGTVLASEDVSLTSGENYIMKLSAIGDIISASIWSADGLSELASISYTGARTNEGYFGIRSGFANTNSPMFVKDLSFEVIPEPATMAFAFAGGTALLVSLKRRRNRKEN